MYVFVTAVSVALVVSFLCSIFESVLLSTSPARIEALTSKGSRAGQILQMFREHIDVPIAAILIVNTIAHTIGATVAGASYVAVFSEDSLWVFSVVFTVAILLLTEIIPKTLGVAFAARLAGPVAYSVRFLTIALGPLVTFASAISRALRGNHKADQVTAEEIRLMAAVARNEGVVGAKAAGIIDGATRLHQLDAGDIIVPRQNIVFLSAGQTWDELLTVIRESGHSRFPYSPSGQLDDITGIVLAKELMLAMQDHPDEVPWHKLVRAAIVIPGSRRLNSLLQVFRSERRHMAIVVDEYGGTEGIVTLEDILEELVGEIDDESDRPVAEIRAMDDGTIRVVASVEMRKLAAHLNEQWDDDAEVHTLSGLISRLLDRIPETGDVLDWRDHRLEVIEASETRAEVVTIRKLSVKSTSPEEQ